MKGIDAGRCKPFVVPAKDYVFSHKACCRRVSSQPWTGRGGLVTFLQGDRWTVVLQSTLLRRRYDKGLPLLHCGLGAGVEHPA
eukprot:CAMPEP_0178522850 /NCGR_PEP_ID=MMETSP0696-20121128/28765_1 /TAXON_ID=265572 /ORGANISM="Extubocellulus spinifer, Strain CCMP396" /LENGTH=82 /DNA_ID=CAMNT_0020154017 /DNA_START=1372 /DNA_END=1616 /DNA_ORIENTATION=+